MKSSKTICCALGTALMLGGCSDNECYENRNAMPLAGFYNSATGASLTVSGLEIGGLGAPRDSLLASGSESMSEIHLPFRIDSDETVYRFTGRLIDESDDENPSYVEVSSTVTFRYSRQARLSSAACGVSYIFTMNDIEVTGQLIDSVTCPQGEITNRNIENLHIYLHDYTLSPQ